MGGGQKEFYWVEKGVRSVGIRVLGGATWDTYRIVGLYDCRVRCVVLRAQRRVAVIGKGDRENE